jgi:chromatin segregation and condensation protein Rec8/ScpA/Scc1 (kleisin family)
MLPTIQSSYTVTIPVYEGPLALLLDLIERAELDITSVPSSK